MSPDEVLAFWFPPGLDRDEPTHRAQIVRWFRGGTDDEIRARFGPTLDAAIGGELDGWAATPRGRLALVLVLDQFSRSIFRGSPRAFAQDMRARALALEGLERADDRGLEPWERLFLVMPLEHSEDLALQDRSVAYAEALAADAPPALRPLYEMSAGQARAHRDVIRRFGRHPHRNDVLGRTSTPDERAYLAAGDLPHTRRI
jgi:uncharacterized protein (DUF924 family)